MVRSGTLIIPGPSQANREAPSMGARHHTGTARMGFPRFPGCSQGAFMSVATATAGTRSTAVGDYSSSCCLSDDARVADEPLT